MDNREWEEQSVNHLLRFLKEACDQEWRITRRDVEVDPITHENFDFELSLAERRIALELFRLVESEPELADRIAWGKFADLLGGEMERRGLNDFSVEIPLVIKASPQAQEKKIRKIVDALEKRANQEPGTVEIEIDHINFRREDGRGAASFWSVGGFGMYDGVDTARRILERMVPKKNKQVSMPEHEGVLLVVHWLGLVTAQDITEACRRFDFSQFQDITRIYFEDASGSIAPAFDRASA